MKSTPNRALQALETKPRDWWASPKAVGEVGIEIECEGARLLPQVSQYWDVKPDGSLRNGGVEYVLLHPLKRQTVRECLELLRKEMDDYGTKVQATYRTSVHVHVNAQDATFRHIYNWMCLYILFEELLVEFGGEERIGNLFCLRVKDAEALLDSLKYGIQQGDYTFFKDKERFKYAAINIDALGRYGSLEFRSFRGTVDVDPINNWVEMLLDLKDSAKKYQDPQEIVGDFSKLGAHAFIKKVFSEKNQAILLNFERLDERLLTGVRYVQEIAFCIPSWQPVAEPEDKARLKKYPDAYGMAPQDGLNAFVDNAGGVRWQIADPALIRAPIRGRRDAPHPANLIVQPPIEDDDF